MARSTSRRRLVAIALALGVLAGCRLFVDLDNITGDAPGDGDAADDTIVVRDDSGRPLTDTGTEEKTPPSDGGDASTGLVDGIVLLLHMDEATWSGASSVVDSSGQKNHGSPVNGAVPAPGKFGNAAKLDGTSWIRVLDSPSLHATQHLTAAAWVNPTGKLDGTLSPGIISKRDGFNANVAWTMFLWTDMKLWVDIGGNRTESSQVFAVGGWYHVAIVFDGTLPQEKRLATYVNAANAGVFPVAADTIPAATSDLLVGNLPMGGDVFQGLIDDAAVWSRSLSASEILTIVTSNKPIQ